MFGRRLALERREGLYFFGNAGAHQLCEGRLVFGADCLHGQAGGEGHDRSELSVAIHP